MKLIFWGERRGREAGSGVVKPRPYAEGQRVGGGAGSGVVEQRPLLQGSETGVVKPRPYRGTGSGRGQATPLPGDGERAWSSHAPTGGRGAGVVKPRPYRGAGVVKPRPYRRTDLVFSGRGRDSWRWSRL